LYPKKSKILFLKVKNSRKLDKKIANGGRFLGRKIGISLVVYGILDKVFEVYLTIFLFTASL
jgi:hypothetical protein